MRGVKQGMGRRVVGLQRQEWAGAVPMNKAGLQIYAFFKSLPERTIESYREKKNKRPCQTFPAITQLGVSVPGV